MVNCCIVQSKLKESQYQLTPWRSDVNHSNIAPPSPSHSVGAVLATSVCLLFFFFSSWLVTVYCVNYYFLLFYYLFYQNTNGLELVPQTTYTHGKVPMSTSDAQTTAEWDLLVRQQGGVGVVPKHLEPEDLGRYSPLASR